MDESDQQRNEIHFDEFWHLIWLPGSLPPSWITSSELQNEPIDTNTRSWLLELGPITERIKANGSFKLDLIKDELGEVNELDSDFLGKNIGEIKIREVLLLSDNNPCVFARSLIPISTIKKGLSKLGELGTNPLGDILFEKEIFVKVETIFVKFSQSENLYWGRKFKYFAKGYTL